MRNSDIHELERALTNGCRSKVWKLIKCVDEMLAKVRPIAETHRSRLAPTSAMKAFQRALDRLRAENAGDPPDVLDLKIRTLASEHAQAHIERDEIRQLEIEMLDDDTPVDLEPIPEPLLHDGGVLRVEPEAFLVLSRLGLIARESK